MMSADFSNEMNIVVPANTDPNPAEITAISRTGNVVHLQVQLPGTSEDGQPLQQLSGLKVFADTDTLMGKLEKLLGMDAVLTVPLDASKIGQVISVDVPDRAAGRWHFRVQPF
jgi:hypothetical protein